MIKVVNSTYLQLDGNALFPAKKDFLWRDSVVDKKCTVTPLVYGGAVISPSMDFTAAKVQKGGISVVAALNVLKSIVASLDSELSVVSLDVGEDSYDVIIYSVQYKDTVLGGTTDNVPAEILMFFL